MILRSSSRVRLVGAPFHWTFAQHAFGRVEVGQLICIREAHLVHVCPVFGHGHLRPTQGHFIATGAPRYYQASLLHGGTHQTAEYPEMWAQSPLPIETFLHIGTWRTRYPKYHWDYSLRIHM